MLVSETGASIVEVRVSARPTLIPTIRAVAGDLAGRADFDLDTIADLRMAVDEACATLVGLDTGGWLSARFVVQDDRIEVTVSAASTPAGAAVNTSSFGWRVLQTLADQVSTVRGVDGVPDALAIRLVKLSSMPR
ncbi:MAG: ATP-binding protein [Pseudonocardia sp.]|nr:ATP-binding protein [Pseudonocardia sp.]